MNSSTENDHGKLYRQFLHDYPLQRANFGMGDWTWVDSHIGNQNLVLLPGFMGMAETSFLYVQAIAPHLRVISLSYPPEISRVERLCDDLCVLLDHLGLRQATLLGGSSSGFIAQAFLQRHPTRVSGLILTHTGLPSRQRARTARILLELLHGLPFGLVSWLMQVSIYAYFPRQTQQHLFWREHFRMIIRQQNRDALANRFALMDDFHSNYRFQPGDTFTGAKNMLLMEMRLDQTTNPAEQAALRELYPQASVHVFLDTAHYDSVENPTEQIGVIKEFILKNS